MIADGKCGTSVLCVFVCVCFLPLYFLSQQEAGLEKELVNLLCKMSAQHHMPILAHHRITTEALRHMTTADLQKVCSAKPLPTIYTSNPIIIQNGVWLRKDRQNGWTFLAQYDPARDRPTIKM